MMRHLKITTEERRWSTAMVPVEQNQFNGSGEHFVIPTPVVQVVAQVEVDGRNYQLVEQPRTFMDMETGELLTMEFEGGL